MTLGFSSKRQQKRAANLLRRLRIKATGGRHTLNTVRFRDSKRLSADNLARLLELVMG